VTMLDYGAGHEDGLPRTVTIHVNQHRRDERDAYIQ
jgi:hypothetical protein